MKEYEIYGNSEISIKGEEIDYVLTVGMNIEKNELYMPSLSFYKDYDYVYQKVIEIWDNENYLIDTLYNQVLIPYIETKSILNVEGFKKLVSIKGFSLKDFEVIKKLMDVGIEKGFFQEYLDKKDGKQN
jgi:hypothetical protein